ncbi:MAG: hypothetical protein ACRDP3_01045 [Streptomyces sp.]|uniref:hypothetical protein n=1 Tax=Streptomyces sp. TaxID=1931 RepID=UPI003D6BC31F
MGGAYACNVPDTTLLITAVRSLSDRLRTLPESALRRGAAAEGLALARELALRAQRLEFPGRVPRELPDAGLFAVGDQLAVAGHDLAEILRGVDDGGEKLTSAVDLVEAGARRVADAVARTR